MNFKDAHRELIPTPVIATFNTSNQVRPLYFQVSTSDGNERIKVDNVASVKKEVDVWWFKCEYGNPVKTVTLLYHTKELMWYIDTKNRFGFNFS